LWKKVPVTLTGRIIAVVLMIAGVGLFGTFTAFVASLFITPEQRQVETREDRILAELREIRQRLDGLEERGRRSPEC
jgi:voltage-gated potassium channel